MEILLAGMLLPEQSAAELAFGEAGAATAGPVNTAVAAIASEAAAASRRVVFRAELALPEWMSVLKASSLK